MLSDALETLESEKLTFCPLCNGSAFKSLSTPGRWIGREVFGNLEGRIGLVECIDCGLIFVNPRPSNSLLGRFYSGETYSCHDPHGSSSAGAKADYLLNQIEKYLPPGAPRVLLDYGAGGGGFMSSAMSRGWKVLGFEPGRRGREACQAAGLDVRDRLEDLPSGSFGLITLHHVFEHLANPAEALDAIKGLLAVDGRLFIEVPNVRSLRARLALPRLSRRYRVDQRHRAFPIHLMYYHYRTLRQMLAKAGWTVEATFTVGLGLDEYLIRSKQDTHANHQVEKAAKPRNPTRRRVRHAIRDAFLGLGLGENLAVIARPSD
jgi:SAM-dependent methyltransferase